MLAFAEQPREIFRVSSEIHGSLSAGVGLGRTWPVTADGLVVSTVARLKWRIGANPTCPRICDRNQHSENHGPLTGGKPGNLVRRAANSVVRVEDRWRFLGPAKLGATPRTETTLPEQSRLCFRSPAQPSWRISRKALN